MREANWEIASHGLKWIDYRDVPEAEERTHMREAIRIHTEVTGERPLGWYTGRSSAKSLELVLEDGGFQYSSDSYADDLPYWVKGPKGPHVIIPYTSRCQRHALRQSAGFCRQRRFLRLSARRFRHPLRRRRDGAKDDVDRLALPPCRTAGTRGGVGAVHRLHRPQGPRLGRHPTRYRAPLASRASRDLAATAPSRA